MFNTILSHVGLGPADQTQKPESEPAQPYGLQKCLKVTMVVSGVLLALGVVLGSIPAVPSVIGNAFIGVSAPFVLTGVLLKIGTHKAESDAKKWAITAGAAATTLVTGIVFASIGFPGAIGRTMIGLSTPMVFAGAIGYSFSRYKAGLPFLPWTGVGGVSGGSLT